jgi:hypothetical protein
MHYYRIRNHIICLDDICNVEPDFSKIIIHFKNGTSVSIYFSDDDRLNDTVDELWLKLIAMR